MIGYQQQCRHQRGEGKRYLWDSYLRGAVFRERSDLWAEMVIALTATEARDGGELLAAAKIVVLVGIEGGT